MVSLVESGVALRDPEGEAIACVPEIVCEANAPHTIDFPIQPATPAVCRDSAFAIDVFGSD